MKQLLIHFSENTTQIALMACGRLVEILINKTDTASVVGQIYAGIVKTILPGQFAFIDIGLTKNAFLNITDAKETTLYTNGKLALKTGQAILVQVTKDPGGEKGAAVTTQLSFSGKNVVVYAHTTPAIGISKKITDEAERTRLKTVAAQIYKDAETPCFGLVLRTACRDKASGDICAEAVTLLAALKQTQVRGQYIKPPAIVQKITEPLQEAIDTLMSEHIERVVINDGAKLAVVQAALDQANWGKQADIYCGEADFLSFFGISAQLAKALVKKVWLPCGGFIVIEQTEACVVIDVNTGKFSKGKDKESTAVQTNREAAQEIAKQLRLRNLSGMIIIDFIGMKAESDKQALVSLLEDETKNDRLRVTVLGMVHLGVVMLTRKKTREPLAAIFENMAN